MGWDTAQGKCVLHMPRVHSLAPKGKDSLYYKCTIVAFIERGRWTGPFALGECTNEWENLFL